MIQSLIENIFDDGTKIFENSSFQNKFISIKEFETLYMSEKSKTIQ